MAGEKIKLIIDTDCGVDDALALLLAFCTENVEIVAITCCCGNIEVEKVWRNVCRVLQHFDRTEIPVYVGCDHPLVNPLKTDADFHGEDGLGNVDLPFDEGTKPESEHAAVALGNYANRYPGQLTLVALAPLTNLVVAQRLDPNFSRNLKNLVFMGGNLKAFGNITVSAEFNVFVDPEAAQVVLNEFVCPIQCVPWEPCFSNSISKSTYQKLISMGTKNSEFVKNITEHAFKWTSNLRESIGYFPCDLLAMACILYPEVIKSKETWYAAIELSGSHTRGQMVVDRSRRSNNKPNVEFVVDFDVIKLNDVITRMLQTK